MIVADTNLLAYLLLPGAHTDAADQVWEKDDEWAAPVLWRSEFRNVLAGYIRKGLLTRSAALNAFRRAEAALGGRELQPDTEKVLTMVEASTCSAYDCEFVALAEELAVPLVTSDSRILQNFPQIALSPADFTALTASAIHHHGTRHDGNVTRAPQHRDPRVLREARIDFGEGAEIEARALARLDDADVRAALA